MLAQVQSILADFAIDYPAESPLWVFQADKVLSNSDEQLINETIGQFLTQWTAHGNSISASHTLIQDRFLLITVNQNMHEASGCSIDALHRAISQLGKDLGIDFLNRSKLTFIVDGQLKSYGINESKKALALGELASNHLLFNNSVASLAAWRTKWLIPINQSWLANFANKA